MERVYRVLSIKESNNGYYLNCYDTIYDESFKKQLGKPTSKEAVLNTEDILQDSDYDISDTLREEIKNIFGITDIVNDDIDDEYSEQKDVDIEEEDSGIDEFAESLNIYPIYKKKLLEYSNRPLIRDIIKKDGDEIKLDKKYKSKISSQSSGTSKINFKRFPGGKVKVGPRYYPKDFVSVTVKGASDPNTNSNTFTYSEYENMPNKDKLKILATHIKDINPNEILYAKQRTPILKKNPKTGKKEPTSKVMWIGFKVKAKDYYEMPDDGYKLELITKEEYDKLPKKVIGMRDK